MSDKTKNQSKVKEKNTKKNTNILINNEIDEATINVSCLINLYEEIEKANLLLKQILEQLFTDHAQMASIKKNLGSRPNIWSAQDAKDWLEVIIANAALGNTQIVQYNEWLVEVQAIVKNGKYRRERVAVSNSVLRS